MSLDAYLDRVVCGDCIDVLRELPDRSVDAVVADPPYGTGAWRRGVCGAGSDCSAHLEREDWDEWSTEWLSEAKRIAPTIIMFLPQLRLVSASEALPGARLCLWVKPDPRPRFGGQMSYGFEPILAHGKLQPIGGPDYRTASAPRANRDTEAAGHPHQKPLSVVRWLVALACPEGGTVLDPFLGSGTTAVACVETGRHFIGIERDAGYCAIAEQRIAAARRAHQPALDIQEATAE